jgi:hypothetical protein
MARAALLNGPYNDERRKRRRGVRRCHYAGRNKIMISSFVTSKQIRLVNHA